MGRWVLYCFLLEIFHLKTQIKINSKKESKKIRQRVVTDGAHMGAAMSARVAGGQGLSVRGDCSVQLSSVAQLCPALCDPMNHRTPGLPVYHQLPEFTQTHVH